MYMHLLSAFTDIKIRETVLTGHKINFPVFKREAISWKKKSTWNETKLTLLKKGSQISQIFLFVRATCTAILSSNWKRFCHIYSIQNRKSDLPIIFPIFKLLYSTVINIFKVIKKNFAPFI